MCIPLERVSSCMCGTAPKRSRPRPRGASVYWHETRDVRFSDIEVKPSRLVVFFFQAEDGIRDRYVTGVQTCALPILELTKPRLDLGDDGNPRLFARHIMMQVDAVAAGFPDRGDAILAHIVLDVGDDDDGALFGQELRAGAADAAGAAGDESDFSFDAIHGRSPSSAWR